MSIKDKSQPIKLETFEVEPLYSEEADFDGGEEEKSASQSAFAHPTTEAAANQDGEPSSYSSPFSSPHVIFPKIRLKSNSVSNAEREAIIEKSLDGVSPRQISALFNLKLNTVRRIIKVFNETGEIEAKAKGGDTRSKLSPLQKQTLRNWVTENFQLKHTDLVRRAREHFGIELSVSTISRALPTFHYIISELPVTQQMDRLEGRRREKKADRVLRHQQARRDADQLKRVFSSTKPEELDKLVFFDMFVFSVSSRAKMGRMSRSVPSCSSAASFVEMNSQCYVTSLLGIGGGGGEVAFGGAPTSGATRKTRKVSIVLAQNARGDLLFHKLHDKKVFPADLKQCLRNTKSAFEQQQREQTQREKRRPRKRAANPAHQVCLLRNHDHQTDLEVFTFKKEEEVVVNEEAETRRPILITDRAKLAQFSSLQPQSVCEEFSVELAFLPSDCTESGGGNDDATHPLRELCATWKEEVLRAEVPSEFQLKRLLADKFEELQSASATRQNGARTFEALCRAVLSRTSDDATLAEDELEVEEGEEQGEEEEEREREGEEMEIAPITTDKPESKEANELLLERREDDSQTPPPLPPRAPRISRLTRDATPNGDSDSVYCNFVVNKTN